MSENPPPPYSGQQPMPAYQPAPGYPVGPPKTLSVTSMVLSLSSVLVALLIPLLGLPVAIAGLICGVIAARREPWAKPFWLTGIIVGGAVTLLAVVGVAVLIVFFVSSAATWY